MKRRDTTTLVALCIALLAHLILLRVGLRAAQRDLGWGLWGPQSIADQNKPLVEPPKNNDDDRMGERNMTGTSINSAPGLVAMESAFADPDQEQALMTRDQPGFKGRSGKTLAQVLSGDNGDDSQQNPAPPADESAQLFASREDALAAAPKSKTPQIDPMSAGPLSPKQPIADADPSAQQQQQQQQKKTTSGGGTPGASSDAAAGTPLPSSNFESFPVTHMAMRFVAGRIIAQNGRHVLTTQIPDFSNNYAALADFNSIPDPHVLLQVKIDDAGHVTDVRTLRSSGSDNIDLPCEHAVATWVFEPLKDPNTGKNRTQETIEMTIKF